MAENIVRTFESLSALLDHAKQPTTFARERPSREDDPSAVTFTGTASWDEAMTLTHRWDDGLAHLQRMSVAIKDSDTATRTVLRKSVAPPGRVDIGGIAAGDPAAGYLQRRKAPAVQRRKGKVIRILFSTGASGGVKADTILRRGAAVLALVDMLEARGFRCEITGCAPTVAARTGRSRSLGTRVLEYRWTVKRADQRVPLSALAFAMAHPSMHRRVIFACREVEPPTIRAQWGFERNIGGSTDSLIAAEVKAGGGIYLPTMRAYDSSHVAFADDEAARQWVKAEVERIMAGR